MITSEPEYCQRRTIDPLPDKQCLKANLEGLGENLKKSIFKISKTSFPEIDEGEHRDGLQRFIQSQEHFRNTSLMQFTADRDSSLQGMKQSNLSLSRK